MTDIPNLFWMKAGSDGCTHLGHADVHVRIGRAKERGQNSADMFWVQGRKANGNWENLHQGYLMSPSEARELGERWLIQHLPMDVMIHGQAFPFNWVGDPIAQQAGSNIMDRLFNMFRERAAVGLAKYGETIDRKDLTRAQWRQHLREELMDALQYDLAEEEADERERGALDRELAAAKGMAEAALTVMGHDGDEYENVFEYLGLKVEAMARENDALKAKLRHVRETVK